MLQETYTKIFSSDYPPRAQALMSAALKLLSERNSREITNKEIAKEAECNTGLIYYYFASKADLFRSAIEYLINQTLLDYQRLTDIYSQPVELIQAWFSQNIKYSDAIRQLLKAMMNYSELNKKFKIQDIIEKFYEHEEKDILASAIADGVRSGLFQSVNPAQVAHFISIQLDGIMCSSYIREKVDIEDELKTTESILWHILGFVPMPGEDQAGANASDH